MNDINPNDVSHSYPPIAHRQIDYIPSPLGSNGGESFKERRKLLIYVGDMVQVIDPKSHLAGKFGLVEEICPKNPQYQVMVKIGKISNPLKFHQLKFCTRIDSLKKSGFFKTGENGGISNNESKNLKGLAKVSDLIDEVDEDDNSGNREGMNEQHGSKL